MSYRINLYQITSPSDVADVTLADDPDVTLHMPRRSDNIILQEMLITLRTGVKPFVESYRK